MRPTPAGARRVGGGTGHTQAPGFRDRTAHRGAGTGGRVV
jgi:hypothetical protein